MHKSGHNIFNLQNKQEKNLEEDKGKAHIRAHTPLTYKGTKIRITFYFPSETIKAKEVNDIFIYLFLNILFFYF